MVTRRLVDYHISRLQDKNRDVRLKSIEELRLIGDYAAMDALEQIFKNDVDPDVRKAAADAGLEIHKKNRQP